MNSYNLSTLCSHYAGKQDAPINPAQMPFDDLPNHDIDSAKPSGTITWHSVQRRDGSQQQVAQITVDSYGRGWEAVKEWLLECVDAAFRSNLSDKTRAERMATAHLGRHIEHLPDVAQHCRTSLNRAADRGRGSVDPQAWAEVWTENAQKWVTTYQATAALSGAPAKVAQSYVFLAQAATLVSPAHQETHDVSKAKLRLQQYTQQDITEFNRTDALCCAATVLLSCAETELENDNKPAAMAHLKHAKEAAEKAKASVGDFETEEAVGKVQASVGNFEIKMGIFH